MPKMNTFVFMNTDLTFQRASADQVDEILVVIEHAKRQLATSGSDQWQDGYPNRASIEEDIRHKWGYVLTTPQHQIAAYGAIVFDGEQAYNDLEGSWTTDQNYVVVHRLAVAEGMKHRGIASEFMRRTETLASSKGIHAFRIDTHQLNVIMLQLLQRFGFTYCGIVRYGTGIRKAFEKTI